MKRAQDTAHESGEPVDAVLAEAEPTSVVRRYRIDPMAERGDTTRQVILDVDDAIAGILDRRRRRAETRATGPAVAVIEPTQPRAGRVKLAASRHRALVRRRKLRRAAATAIALGLVALFLAYARHQWSRAGVAGVPHWVASPQQAAEVRPTAENPRPRLPVDVRTDPLGAPMRIEAPDPARVLVAFCAVSERAAQLRPLGTRPATAHNDGVVLGFFEDLHDLTHTPAIRIHLDPRNGRWVTGDGRSPIDLVDAGAAVGIEALERTALPRVELRFAGRTDG